MLRFAAGVAVMAYDQPLDGVSIHRLATLCYLLSQSQVLV